MLSGLKFIPRDQIDSAQDENLNNYGRGGENSGSRKGKDEKKKKKSRHSSSDEDLERIKKGSRKKKWYSSDEDLPSYSDDSESDTGSERDTRISKSRKKEKKKRDKSKKKSRKRKEYCSDEHSDEEERNTEVTRRDGRNKCKEKTDKDIEADDVDGDVGFSHSLNDSNIIRKEMGLEWMLRPKDDMERKSVTSSDLPDEPPVDEVKKGNPRELNPYLKDIGTGYPEDATRENAGGNHLLSTFVVGDGGASWRLKALKRAQEQAAREGRKLDEVVEERWGSLGKLAVSVASNSAAPSHAHLHAIKSRIRRQTGEQRTILDDQNNIGKESLKGGSVQHPKMRVPKLHDSLSWGKRKSQNMSAEDAGLISSAVSSLNKFANDGSFMRGFKGQQNHDSGPSFGSSNTVHERKVDSDLLESEKPDKGSAVVRPALSANQLAAKVMQLRMKGKHDEAEKLLKEAEENKGKNNSGGESSMPQGQGDTSRYTMQGTTVRQKRKEEDADMHLAQTIVQNKQYSMSGRADDEYDFDEGPRRKTRKKGGNDPQPMEKIHAGTRILTQQERCNFCFENPNRPRHLVVAIANFTYLMLPQWQPVAPGHCCILPMLHESSTRTVDNNVWDEIRNFKKCLIMMFAKQEKDLVFIETVMGLAQQRRHCLVECIPLPQEIARQAPLYFKKAIDEAESEWSQHNAKKLIDTSEKGLRASIPKDFPYFHVEFGLKKGFVHVIDDESQFQSNFGLNVIRGMLQLPAEDMHRRRKHESIDTQKQAVKSFLRDWEPFDWTKQLD